MSERPPQSMAARTEKKVRARAYLKTISKVPMGRGVVHYAPPLERSEVLTIASEILQLDLSSDRSGRYYLTCPGSSLHSGGKNARRDCEFLPDGAPTLRCFHESCSGVLDEMNRTIRSACGKAKVRKFTDSTARATKAAEALLIGFAMSDAEAESLLSEWARSCDPQIPSADLSAALKSAKRSLDRTSADNVGCLLHGGSMPAAINSPRPLREEKLSDVSSVARPSASKPGATQGVGAEQPIYLGPLGKLAKQARNLIEAFEDDYGYRPARLLVGTSFTGELPARIAGLPAERWDHREHSVMG